MLLLLNLLNSKALPYPDPMHPIVVHFVIAMVLFSFGCDVVGYFTGNYRLFEVSWWNLLVASVSIFVAVLFGQFEASIAPTYPAVEAVLTAHTVMGWSLAAAVVGVTTLRLIIHRRFPTKLPAAYLGFATALACLVLFQTYLGTQLVWVYGLHIEPVVKAIETGGLP
jgi:uncharacterized membrane protein